MSPQATRAILALTSDWEKGGVVLDMGTPSPDILLVAGNLTANPSPEEKIRVLREAAGKGRVLFVPGPKDLGGHTIEEGVRRLRKAAQGMGVRVLYRNQVKIQGVVFLGATLWPSLDLMGEEGRRHAERLGAPFYGAPPIHGRDGQNLGWAEIRDEHARDTSWLAQQLRAHPDMPKVVLTHFPPSPRSLGSPLAPSSALSASACEPLVRKSCIWVHGHVSQPVFYQVGSVAPTGLVAAWPQAAGEKEGLARAWRFQLEDGQVALLD